MRRLLLWMPLVLWFIEAVKGGLEVPQNVRIHAVNTQYVLKWDWRSQGAHRNVTFTAGYLLKSIRKKSGFISVCEHIMETHCDFCKIPFHYNGLFYFQVRAESGDEHSSWSQKTFEPEEHAELGPPSDVHVVPVNYMLKVNITDPKDCNNASMRQHLSFSYVIVYWKNASDLKNESKVTKLTTVVLSNLAPHTTYCLKVQLISDKFNKTSNFSRVACEKTLGDDDAPSGLNPDPHPAPALPVWPSYTLIFTFQSDQIRLLSISADSGLYQGVSKWIDARPHVAPCRKCASPVF
ncbi:interferon alpha/beta receptor 1a-like isoform X2 [Polypterus senegalus]|uniref:interferon alpha/beta receptor 1a-like isoform X2 n=1 Tax=Polypterus senegalus TaxID=55291 RepID=UPI0019626F3E|nr:interferon alpha/beta receptor 1a-like isoform X2 [Polypterus senegalus]